MIESMAGVDMLHVPYKGAAPALQDVMGERVALYGGHHHLVAAAGEGRQAARRWPSPVRTVRRKLPDVPTVAEAGRARLRVRRLVHAAGAGARRPRRCWRRLNAELRRVEALPGVQAPHRGHRRRGREPDARSRRAAYLDREFDEAGAKVVKDRNIKAE